MLVVDKISQLLVGVGMKFVVRVVELDHPVLDVVDVNTGAFAHLMIPTISGLNPGIDFKHVVDCPQLTLSKSRTHMHL